MVLANMTLDLEHINIILQKQLLVTWDIFKTQMWHIMPLWSQKFLPFTFLCMCFYVSLPSWLPLYLGEI